MNEPQKSGRETSVISIKEVAEMMGLSLGVVYGAVKSGQIPSITVGRRVVVPRAPFYRLIGREEGAPRA
jgi:excisionase family DNA binding protein